MNIYQRLCSVTKKPMNEGYVVGQISEEYAIDKSSLMILLQKLGYSDMKKAYKDEVYYYTEWYDEDEVIISGYFYTESGREHDLKTKTGQAVLLFAKEKFKESFKVFKTFRIGFSQIERSMLSIAYDILTGKDDYYKQLGVDTVKAVEDAKELIISKYQ